MGAFGSKSLKFIKELATLHSGDSLASCHFIQHLSVTVQLGNAASILSTSLALTYKLNVFLFFFFYSLYTLVYELERSVY